MSAKSKIRLSVEAATQRGQSLALLRLRERGIAFAMQRIKAAVALLLALVWLPAVSCCLIDASGLLGRQDCCSKNHSHPASGPGNCDKPCGVLASATFLPHQVTHLILLTPVGELLFDCASYLNEVRRPVRTGCKLPAAAPPQLAGNWQFSFRTALSPRAPSFAS